MLMLYVGVRSLTVAFAATPWAYSTMSDCARWWEWLDDIRQAAVDGLVPVAGYRRQGRPPEEAALIEKAQEYGADAVLFEAGQNGRAPIAQAFVYGAGGPLDDQEFAELHRKLWSWGGVPLIYRKTRGLLQLFRCAHGPDFVEKRRLRCSPVKMLDLASTISADPWWDAERLHTGSLWDNAEVCRLLLSAKKSAHKSLFDAVRALGDGLDDQGILPRHLRRKLLILSLLIAYLEQREVFPTGYFSRFVPGATRFFEVLADGRGLVSLLKALEERFNGNVFTISDADAERLKDSLQLVRFSKLVEGREEQSGQLTLWQLYSFRDLPVELISQIYQLFVKNTDSSVYTPPFLVKFLIEESLSWKRLDRLRERGEIILDPSCGSGVFLVEAYKRLVLHWRIRNQWKRPGVDILKSLLKHVHGIDLEEGAVELAAFSLCLALCDALEPETIRRSIKLFPPLAGTNLHHACFFEAKEQGLIGDHLGVVIGNPPFASSLTTKGAERSYKKYTDQHGKLPDKQLGYLFLHEAMEMVATGGLLCMLQQYNFLYNQNSLPFRRQFLRTHNVRELIDLVSVRGMFHKGNADTKIIVVLAEKAKPPREAKILHVTFRRSGRTDAEQGFDLDYYDLHYVPNHVALTNGAVWRANLMGGGRALSLATRLSQYRTIGDYAKSEGWDFGEGFIEGKSGKRQVAKHITGKRYLPSIALTDDGPDITQVTTVEATKFKSFYSEKRFTPPMLLIREHKDLAHCLWTDGYLTYSQRIVGFCAPASELQKLQAIDAWLTKSRRVLIAHLALTSPGLFAQKATALQADDVYSILFPEDGDLDLSENEQVVVDDLVDYYGDFVRLGEDSAAMRQGALPSLPAFNDVFCKQINTVYKERPLRALEPQSWAGVICQPFSFGGGEVDWSGADQLKGKVGALLHQQSAASLRMTRICRIYDGRYVFLLKPDRLRYWLRSIALRDADETLADLRAQGF